MASNFSTSNALRKWKEQVVIEKNKSKSKESFIMILMGPFGGTSMLLKNKACFESLFRTIVDHDTYVQPAYRDVASTYTLPQKAFPNFIISNYHRCHLIPNPYILRLKQKSILIISSQCVGHILKISPFIKTPQESIEAIFRWRHLCPCMPDFDVCSYVKRGELDPLLLFPIYAMIIGSHDKWWPNGLQYTLENVRIICLPSFHKDQYKIKKIML